MQIWPPFDKLKRSHKIVFTFIVAVSIITFWKGIWGLSEVFFDELLFSGKHLFWSNFTAMFFGLLVLLAAGMGVKRIA